MKKILLVAAMLLGVASFATAQLSQERLGEIQKGLDVLSELNDVTLKGSDVEFLVARNKGVRFFTFGFLELCDYYNYDFSNAQPIAQATKFKPYSDVKGAGKNSWYFYIPYEKKINDVYGTTGLELVEYMSKHNKTSVPCFVMGYIPENLDNSAGRMALGMPILLDTWDILGDLLQQALDSVKNPAKE